MKNNIKGFTLIELMLVIIIITCIIVLFIAILYGLSCPILSLPTLVDCYPGS